MYPPGVAASPAPSGLARSVRWWSCCWMSGEAAFRAARAARCSRVRVVAYLPDRGPYDERPQTLTITIDGISRRTFGGLHSGIYDLEVPLPPHAGTTPAVRVSAAYTFQPGLRAARRFSAVLKGVFPVPSGGGR